MFTVLSSLLSWGKEKCPIAVALLTTHCLWKTHFLPLLLHGSSQIYRLLTWWRFLFLAYTKHSHAVTVLLSFRIMSLKCAQRKHQICMAIRLQTWIHEAHSPQKTFALSHTSFGDFGHTKWLSPLYPGIQLSTAPLLAARSLKTEAFLLCIYFPRLSYWFFIMAQ